MDALPRIPPFGSQEALDDYVGTLCRDHGDRATLLAAALRPFVPLAKAEAERQGELKAGYSCLSEALYIIADLQIGLAPEWRPDGYRRRLWVHTRTLPEPGATEDTHAIEKRDVEAAAARYLKATWMSDGHLDWIIVDALTRNEIMAFEHEVARAQGPARFSMGWWMRWVLTVSIAWVVEGVIALGTVWWLTGEYAAQAPYRHWWAAAAALYYGVAAIRLVRAVRPRRARKKEASKAMAEVTALCATMRDCYLELHGPVLNPTRVRNVLLAAEAKGTRWSTATWPVLENAIRRNPTVWVTGAQ